VSEQAGRDAALIAEYDAEKPGRTLSGWSKAIVWALGVALSLYAIYWVFAPFGTINASVYVPAFTAIALAMTFVVYRGWRPRASAGENGRPDNPHPVDWVLAGLAIVPMAYAVIFYVEFSRRAAGAATRRCQASRWSPLRTRRPFRAGSRQG
jgi:TRAP-type uncharacterized transport system fused permease subunit